MRRFRRFSVPAGTKTGCNAPDKPSGVWSWRPPTPTLTACLRRLLIVRRLGSSSLRCSSPASSRRWERSRPWRQPPGPQGRDHRRAGRRRHRTAIAPRRGPRPRRPQVHAGRHRALLPERDVAGGQRGAPGRQRSSSTWATATAGRARIATRSTRPPRTASGSTRGPAADDYAHQYFGEAGSRQRQAREERGRPAPPPLLRQSGNTRARRRRGHARPGEAAGRQLRRRLHQGRRVGRDRRGVREPRPHASRPSSAAAGRSTRSGAHAPARTATPSRSRARAAPGTSPRWTRRAARPGSRVRSCCESGLASADVLAGAAARPSRGGDRRSCRARPEPGSRRDRASEPDLQGRDAAAGPPSSTSSASRSRTAAGLPKSIEASVRWDPLDAP